MYLGRFGSAAARAEYDRVVSEWLAAGRCLPRADAPLTVNKLCIAYLQYAIADYRRPDGGPAPHVESIRHAIGPLRKAYGRRPAAEFDSLALLAVRDAMVDAGLCRSTINKRIGIVKALFKWGVSRTLVAGEAWRTLDTVTGLRKGRCAAPEPKAVRPVAQAWIDLTLPHLPPGPAAMVSLQLLTGMRPGEVCAMRCGAIDTSGKVWSTGRNGTKPTTSANSARSSSARGRKRFCSRGCGRSWTRRSSRRPRPMPGGDASATGPARRP
ncbi:MAG: hypothetical protein HYS13_11680 [Planctomycetia bacterium]|nr:hypothetical protein [Planctomycetia bacterium]